jgi:hypothetical protein
MDDESRDAMEELNQGDPQVAALVMQLMLASSEDNRHVLNSLVAGYQEDNYRLRATVLYIQHSIDKLLSGPFMPMPHAILEKLHPLDDQLEPLIARLKEADNR